MEVDKIFSSTNNANKTKQKKINKYFVTENTFMNDWNVVSQQIFIKLRKMFKNLRAQN